MSATDDIYEGSLHREAERGGQTVTFKVPGGRPDEICVVPKHLPFAKYRGKDGAKDIADEQRLASYDFYRAGPAEAGVVAPLPKRSSTSAAVDIYTLPAASARPEQLTATYCTALEKTGKCVAKFKQTDNKFTTTSSAAILGYYHVARALGDICEIKPAVLRTMDIEQHKKVVRLASEMGVHGTIAKSWELFSGYYADPRGSDVARDLFTSDFTQIYGALLENTTGEDSYTEWLNAGSDLANARAFQQMADSRPASAILGSTAFTPSNVQALVAIRDMSELILLDYLLAQSDRLTGGNISDYSFAYYLEGGKVKSTKASKAADIPAGAPQVTVKKLTIKDTDAGLLNTNLFEQKGYLSRIHQHASRHLCRLADLCAKMERRPDGETVLPPRMHLQQQPGRAARKVSAQCRHHPARPQGRRHASSRSRSRRILPGHDTDSHRPAGDAAFTGCLADRRLRRSLGARRDQPVCRRADRPAPADHRCAKVAASAARSARRGWENRPPAREFEHHRRDRGARRSFQSRSGRPHRPGQRSVAGTPESGRRNASLIG